MWGKPAMRNRVLTHLQTMSRRQDRQRPHAVDVVRTHPSLKCTTGQIRGSTTDDIACWFIDTDYDEESFFVRHAYFAGADEPYKKLQRALKAEIDEEAWPTTAP